MRPHNVWSFSTPYKRENFINRGRKGKGDAYERLRFVKSVISYGAGR